MNIDYTHLKYGLEPYLHLLYKYFSFSGVSQVRALTFEDLAQSQITPVPSLAMLTT